MSLSSYLILNCLSNTTCQFFSNFPRQYKIEKQEEARLYFLRGIFPNTSQCCMPNITYLLNKLQNSPLISSKLYNPRCLVLDNHGYLVTISQTNSSIVLLDPINMTVISHTISLLTSATTITYYNGNYYVGLSNSIIVIQSNNFTIRNTITSSYLSGTRDMIFLNNGNILVVVSTNNKYLLFFNRSSNVSTNYDFAYKQLVSYPYPHGLFYINDSYFYATSWGYNTIYSYSAVQGDIKWRENLFLDARSTADSSNGNHITIDECGRFWFSLGTFGVEIYGNDGSLLGSLTLTNSNIFDTIITDNYVIYLSDVKSNQIIRIDPDIQC